MLLPTAEEIITIDEAKILIWEFDDNIENLCNAFDNFDLYRYDLDEIKSSKRKLEFLGSRLLLKLLIGKEVAVKYNIEGKPTLLDNSYQISISHSKNWIAVIIHPYRLVGIDIECPNDKILRVYKRFLSKTEQKQLSEGKDIKQLMLAWSAKEALYKIIGKDAVDFSKHLRILPFEVNRKGEIIAIHNPSNINFELKYIQIETYTLVYCIA